MGSDIHGVFQRRNGNTWEDVHSKYNENRHYQLFAVPSGVRNGHGFAGCLTGQAVEPIASPRGFPTDFAVDGEDHPIASLAILPEWRQKYREEDDPLVMWMGDHSHSWLSGSEMLAWHEEGHTVTQTGIVSRDFYETWDRVSKPDAYSGGIWGHEVIQIEDSEGERSASPNWTHIRVYWQSDLKQELAYFFDEVARLQAEHGEVRFVFGFDN